MHHRPAHSTALNTLCNINSNHLVYEAREILRPSHLLHKALSLAEHEAYLSRGAYPFEPASAVLSVLVVIAMPQTVLVLAVFRDLMHLQR